MFNPIQKKTLTESGSNGATMFPQPANTIHMLNILCRRLVGNSSIAYRFSMVYDKATANFPTKNKIIFITGSVSSSDAMQATEQAI